MKQIETVGFWKALKVSWGYHGPFRKNLIISTVVATVVAAISISIPYLFGRMTDHVYNLQGSIGFQVITYWAVAFLLIHVVRNIFYYIGEYNETKYLDVRVDGHLYINSLKKVFNWTLGQIYQLNSGKRMRIISKGESSLTGFMGEVLYNIIPMSLRILYTAIALVWIDWRLGLFVAAWTVAYAFIMAYRNRADSKELSRIEQIDNSESIVSHEIFNNLPLVKLHNKEEFGVMEVTRYEEGRCNRHNGFWLKYLNFFWSVRSIIVLAEVSTLVLAGYLTFITGSLTPGLLITCVIWARDVVGEAAKFGSSQRRLMRQITSISEYERLINEPPLFKASGGIVAPKLRGDIELQNVSFMYPKRMKEQTEEIKVADKSIHKALDGITLTFEAGKRYAIVGHSGSGKSTLRQLLLRAYDPQEGKILFDGKDVKEYNLSSLHKHIAVVEQEVAVFDRSIKENITWVLPDPKKYSEEKLQQVVEMAAITQFLPQLEHGLDTLLGERGVKLSGGERQRVGIARALMKDPQILILDEATSHLDAINEDDITQALEQAAKGRTTIVIAHRLSTIVTADEIVVLEKGKLVGKGTHQELLKTCEPYKDLVETQVVAMNKLNI